MVEIAKKTKQKQLSRQTKRQKTNAPAVEPAPASQAKKARKTKEKTEKTKKPATAVAVAPVVQEVSTIDDSYFRVVTGSYERLLHGLDIYWPSLTKESDEVSEVSATESKDKDNTKLRFEPVFAFPAHIGCLKAIGAGGNYLASGSTDELIKLYDLKNRKELGTLMHHDGTITSLEFCNKTHMISAGDDGKLCIWRTKDWECLRILKGHTGAINCADVHPTGRVALSVGADRTLRSWDLTIGGKLTSSKLKQAGNIVRWSLTGQQYAIVTGRQIDIYNVANAKITRTFLTRTTLHCLRYAKDKAGRDLLVLGGDDKRLRIYHADEEEPIVDFVAHDARIKDLSILPSASTTRPTVIVTVASSGQIRIWDLEHLLLLAKQADPAIKTTATTTTAKSVTPLGDYNTGCRITCVLAVHGFAKQ
ncbi:WD40-repeat-containing domain protein [Syncephalis fuscata]|nr:WD40-repeat-containing domain protein [Syncephalis fuscata]